MRVLIVSRTYVHPPTRGKLRALAGLGCAVSVAVPDRWLVPGTSREVTVSWADDAGVRVVPIPVRGLAGTGDNAQWSRRALRRLMTDFRPDILQIEEEPWTPVASRTAGLAARLHHPATLFTWESVTRPLPLYLSWRRRRTLARVRGLVGGNRLAANLVGRARPDLPVGVFPQLGVTPPLHSNQPDRAGLAIGFVGRLVPERGLDLLCRACVKLLGRWTLTVVGSGPAQEQLEALAERLGIAARVTWIAALPPEQLTALWDDLDCLAIPSRTTPRWVETFSLPLIEAMGHGVTVIGSDSGALPEMIDTAGLVVPEDDVVALTAALQHLSDSPRERHRFGREGRQRVMAEYTDDAVARKTLEFWDRVLKR